MAYDYSELIAQTKQWAEQAVNKGWLGASAAQQLLDFDLRAPGSLFNGQESRPLIVAFMGGTGVGKSSLLNRLAGATIAKAGVERPTSKEVTLFHHRNVVIRHLPELPLTQISIAQHDDVSKQNIIWMDMPDFDSTELSNKQQVLQWLPHIDVLIYVVSPERYRDEKAWRLLLAEGGKHAWLFVLNQWDKGQIEQLADFRQQLHKAGFVNPIIFTTSCAEFIQTDEFSSLQETLLSLANDHTIKQLEQKGLQFKTHELKQKLQHCKQALGSEQSSKQLAEAWNTQWQRTSADLQKGFAWPIQKISAYYAEHAADLISKTTAQQPQLWDAWAQTRFDDAVDEIIANANQMDIPVTPYKNQLVVYRDKAAKTVQSQSELAARQALVNPGHAVQRIFLKAMRICEIILPLAAISWVAYQVFMGYYHSNMSNTHYLGVDFAIHSALLIAISWLLPFFILKKLKPSLEASALRGLNRGLHNGLAMIDTDISIILADISQQQLEQIQQLNSIIINCATTATINPTINQENVLNRMLID